MTVDEALEDFVFVKPKLMGKAKNVGTMLYVDNGGKQTYHPIKQVVFGYFDTSGNLVYQHTIDICMRPKTV